jgi:hypothetical protein
MALTPTGYLRKMYELQGYLEDVGKKFNLTDEDMRLIFKKDKNYLKIINDNMDKKLGRKRISMKDQNLIDYHNKKENEK